MLQTIKWVLGGPVVNRAHRLARAFLDQTLHAPAVQRQLLLDQIARNADSQFGRDHHFHEIRTPDDFRRQVPVTRYPSAVMTATSHTSTGSGRATSRRFSARGPEF